MDSLVFQAKLFQGDCDLLSIGSIVSVEAVKASEIRIAWIGFMV